MMNCLPCLPGEYWRNWAVAAVVPVNNMDEASMQAAAPVPVKMEKPWKAAQAPVKTEKPPLQVFPASAEVEKRKQPLQILPAPAETERPPLQVVPAPAEVEKPPLQVLPAPAETEKPPLQAVEAPEETKKTTCPTAAPKRKVRFADEEEGKKDAVRITVLMTKKEAEQLLSMLTGGGRTLADLVSEFKASKRCARAPEPEGCVRSPEVVIEDVH